VERGLWLTAILTTTVTTVALKAWGSGFALIRSASAMRFGSRVLNRRDCSSWSNLNSTNVSHLTSPQPEKREVGGSIPPLDTIFDLHGRGDAPDGRLDVSDFCVTMRSMLTGATGSDVLGPAKWQLSLAADYLHRD
jgi:hypothetical protein